MTVSGNRTDFDPSLDLDSLLLTRIRKVAPGLSVHDFLDLEVDGKKVEDVLTPLKSLIGTDPVVSQKQTESGYQLLQNSIPASPPNLIYPSDQDVDAVFTTTTPEMFYHPEGRKGSPNFWQLMRTTIGNYWRQDDEHFFDDIPEFSRLPDINLNALALVCPRTLKGEKVDFSVFGIDMEKLRENPSLGSFEAIRYQMAFLKFAKEADEPSNQKDQETLKRKAYASAQIATFLSLKFSTRIPLPPINKDVPSPSTDIFSRLPENHPQTKEAVGKYIETVLHCIVSPSKNSDFPWAIQEDFVTADLKGLAIRHGIYEKYASVFEAIKVLRQIQFILSFHLSPNQCEDHDSLLELIAKFIQKRKELPTIAVLGAGNGLLEQFLAKLGLIKKCHSVDVDHESDSSITSEKTMVGGIIHATRHGIRDLIEDSELGPREKPEVHELVMKDLPDGVDLAICTETLHEILGNQFRYIHSLWEKITSGGTIYLSDPVYCEAYDGLTDVSMNEFDSTRNVRSMLAIEDVFDLLAYLATKKANVKDAYVKIHGFNDFFARIRCLIRKPRPEKSNFGPYLIPQENTDQVQDIWTVWPLSLLKPDEKNLLLEKIPGLGNVQLLADDRQARKVILETLTNFLTQNDSRDIIPVTWLIKTYSPLQKAKIISARVADEELAEQNESRGVVFALKAAIESIMKLYTTPQNWRLDLGPNWPVPPIPTNGKTSPF